MIKAGQGDMAIHDVDIYPSSSIPQMLPREKGVGLIPKRWVGGT